MTDETQTAEAQTKNEYAQAWRPSVGDVLTGNLLGVEMIDPGGNGAYPCVTLQTSGGEVAVHAFHSVLRRELARRAPKVGDEVTITYLGEKPGGKNGTYHVYKVRGGQAQEFDWSSQLPEEEREGYQASSAAPPIPPAAGPPPPPPPPAGEPFGDEPPF